jgi:hypothetical protein
MRTILFTVSLLSSVLVADSAVFAQQSPPPSTRYVVESGDQVIVDHKSTRVFLVRSRQWCVPKEIYCPWCCGTAAMVTQKHIEAYGFGTKRRLWRSPWTFLLGVVREGAILRYLVAADRTGVVLLSPETGAAVLRCSTRRESKDQASIQTGSQRAWIHGGRLYVSLYYASRPAGGRPPPPDPEAARWPKRSELDQRGCRLVSVGQQPLPSIQAPKVRAPTWSAKQVGSTSYAVVRQGKKTRRFLLLKRRHRCKGAVKCPPRP